MRILILILALGFSGVVMAGDWTSAASVENIEIIRGQGFQIKGEFGNPSECEHGNAVFIALEHPQYDQLLSMSMAAFMGNKRLKIFSHQCASYGWHGGNYNELTVSGAMYLQN